MISNAIYYLIKTFSENDTTLGVYNSGICNYLVSTENAAGPVDSGFPANMPNVFSITTDVDKLGNTWARQASAASASLQLSPFHHNAAATQAPKQRHKLLSWPLHKYRRFCQNTLMKAMIHSEWFCWRHTSRASCRQVANIEFSSY